MRKDMKDVIVNTGRYRNGGSGAGLYSRNKIRHADPDDLPSRIPISRRRQYGSDCKELGDRTNPFRCYLAANVGRPWADVWHEICEHADTRSIRGFHLRSHVWDNLAKDKWGKEYATFFIDDDGTLQRVRILTPEEREARAREYGRIHKVNWFDGPKPPDPTLTESSDHWWTRIEGIWYEFITTHWTTPCSCEELIEENGKVKIVRIQKKDEKHSKTIKRQVNSKNQKYLDELFKHPGLIKKGHLKLNHPDYVNEVYRLLRP
jgi:hypothetical protein